MLRGKMLSQDNIESADVLLREPIQRDQLLSVIDSKLKNKNIEVNLPFVHLFKG